MTSSPAGNLRADALAIADSAIRAARPGAGVERALKDNVFPGRVIAIAVGKAAWSMASATSATLGERIDRGFLICDPSYLPQTAHEQLAKDSPLVPGFSFLPAEHPVPGAATMNSTRIVLDAVTGLAETDTVILLLSGGSSSMFEAPLIGSEHLRALTEALLKSNIDISGINAVRKRLSRVKAGRFAQACAPAHVLCLILSDVFDGHLDTVGSGPTCCDTSSPEEALEVLRACGYADDEHVRALIERETTRHLDNVENILIGDASLMVEGAVDECRRRGFETTVLASPITGEARRAGYLLAHKALEELPASSGEKPQAWIGAGETTVEVMGNGLGGRNLEVALSAAMVLDGASGCCLLSVGSDGRDGPCDVAGGYADGNTVSLLDARGIDPLSALTNNDSYHALAESGGLIRTGETGTNVGDLLIMLRASQDML